MLLCIPNLRTVQIKIVVVVVFVVASLLTAQIYVSMAPRHSSSARTEEGSVQANIALLVKTMTNDIQDFAVLQSIYVTCDRVFLKF